MSDWEGKWNPPDWTTHEQTRSMIESEVRHKIMNEIRDYADMCKAKGMSTYFVSGLEVSASIAAFGKPTDVRQEETLF